MWFPVIAAYAKYRGQLGTVRKGVLVMAFPPSFIIFYSFFLSHESCAQFFIYVYASKRISLNQKKLERSQYKLSVCAAQILTRNSLCSYIDLLVGEFFVLNISYHFSCTNEFRSSRGPFCISWNGGNCNVSLYKELPSSVNTLIDLTNLSFFLLFERHTKA
jgi:hypothetical protein